MKKILPKNNVGFTLVELMVVVTIIAILTIIGITVFTSVQKNARNARRTADIDSIANAMEANFDKGDYVGQYQPLLPSFFSSGNIPQDPINKPQVATGVSGSTTACDSLGCQYCYREGIVQQSTIHCDTSVTTPPTTIISGTAKPAGSTTGPYWAVCANLEGGGSYCRQNIQ